LKLGCIWILGVLRLDGGVGVGVRDTRRAVGGAGGRLVRAGVAGAARAALLLRFLLVVLTLRVGHGVDSFVGGAAYIERILR
jgi:hypothetical protein